MGVPNEYINDFPNFPTMLEPQGQNWHSPNVTTWLALKMAACRLLNFMNMYDVDFTAHRIAFVYIVDQSQIAGTEAAC